MKLLIPEIVTPSLFCAGTEWWGSQSLRFCGLSRWEALRGNFLSNAVRLRRDGKQWGFPPSVSQGRATAPEARGRRVRLCSVRSPGTDGRQWERGAGAFIRL